MVFKPRPPGLEWHHTEVRKVVFRDLLAFVDVPVSHDVNLGADVKLGDVVIARVVEQGQRGVNGGGDLVSLIDILLVRNRLETQEHQVSEKN